MQSKHFGLKVSATKLIKERSPLIVMLTTKLLMESSPLIVMLGTKFFKKERSPSTTVILVKKVIKGRSP